MLCISATSKGSIDQWRKPHRRPMEQAVPVFSVALLDSSF